MKKIFLILFLSFLIFSKEYSKKDLIQIVEENEKFECISDKKIIRFEGINFIGHLDEEGKPYGEWKLKDDRIRQCFLENEKITYEKEQYFSKRNEKIDMTISYTSSTIQLFIKDDTGVKNYFLKREKNKYKIIKNQLMTLTESIPLYNLIVVK